MKRPWQVWLVFFVCVVGAGAAMAWLTREALVADRLRRVAEAETELEQRVNLALWQMDTELAPIIANEVIRPASAYRRTDAVAALPPYVLLQFEASENGVWQSPQEPLGKSSEPTLLSQLRQSVNLPSLASELPDTPLPTAGDAIDQIAAANTPWIPSNPTPNQYFGGNQLNAQPPEQQQVSSKPTGKGMNLPQAAQAADFQQRGARYQTATQQSLANSSLQQQEMPLQGKSAREQAGVSRPVWIGDHLILARRVSEPGGTIVQGSVLNWPQIKQRLLSEVVDSLPGADLVRADGAAADDPSRMLAGLPVRLVVGAAPAAGSASPTMRAALWIGWGALALTVLAAAVLLRGVMALSERRAAFVSSVTHELRTPLTTFRMYAEMLARGMVPDAARRQEYFNTLQREAERLTLLVENVLAYARLERGRKPQASDRITLRGLLERVGPRLTHRAAQADMPCDLRLEQHAAEVPFTTDQAIVEQILFNLVDNAAKYAREAENRQIHVEASRDGDWIKLIVRDHGPGIEQRGFGRAPRAFGKSAQESAETAPGVGLGLALCRRLARQLGGRLEIDSANGGGASVSLHLPTS